MSQSKGKIVQIIGTVVDVEFEEGSMPGLFNALTLDHNGKTVTLEVARHLGFNQIRAIALNSTDGIKRGTEVHDTGAPVSVPVGKQVLGKLFNVFGKTIDESDKTEFGKRWPIHRSAPALVDQLPKTEIFETGIKVIDLLAPFVRGGKVGSFET